MVTRDDLLRRQKALGEFGRFILKTDDLQKILHEGCRIVADALGADLAKVVEIERATETGLIRAGVGWNAGIVGNERVDLNEKSSESYAIETSEPVITQDIAEEDRFEFPQFMRDHGVAAIVNTPVVLPGGEPWGLLQVDAREPRAFEEEDVEFLETYAMVLGPVIDRLQTATELGETDEQLRLVLQNARDYVIILSDVNDLITAWLAGSEEILGWKADEVIGKTTRITFMAEERERGVPERELQAAREVGASPNVRWHLRKDGRRVFLDGQTIALRDKSGAVRGFLKIGQDVTERKRNEERQSVLLAELQHRVRNVLAVVRSLISRTVKGATRIEEVGKQLEGRINALARTQTLLTGALGTGVRLDQIIRDELEAQAADEDRFAISGPPVELAPKAAEVVTLAIHELATNALKYGALSQEDGQLDVSWTVDRERTPPWLRLRWREDNLTLPEPDKRRAGFGTELVTRRVPYDLRGRGKIEFYSSAVEADLEFPLTGGASILETGAPA